MEKIIKVLGTGCAKCKTLEASVRELVSSNNYPVEVIKIDDIMEIMQFGIMTTPGLVLGDQVAFSGRVPSKDELKKYIEQYINA